MRFTSVRIQNFKGLKDVSVPLSQFGCLIGENNSGKSSVLQALLLLLGSSSRKPLESDFFDPTSPIRIELRIDDITEDDFARIENDAHRASFEGDVDNGSVRLVRYLDPTPGSKLQLFVCRRGPKDDNWTTAVLDAAMKNKTGTELREAALELIPELESKLTGKPTQKAIREARDELVGELDDDQLTDRDEPLPTGLDAGIKNFLPEPIYIEAVKDVADDVKTTESATFGKLLSLLLEEVRDQFDDVEEQFKGIQRKLSRVLDEDGRVVDERIEQVRTIENLINSFVRESFPDVDLTIAVPVPEMRTILSSAKISANDGHDGPVTSKGDGLKRAVAFAILRAYTNLRSGINKQPHRHLKGHYWLLFEEPELYLYPRAQKQLFSALELFSQDHPVLVTTHSPVFFDAETTRSFIKFRKVRSEEHPTPYTAIHPILIDDQPTKAVFQIICHENNSIGFFAKKVVLVEGDSDVVLLRHIAKLLDSRWDTVEQNIAFARTNGKGNISSYRSFFQKFDIPVHVICDLDTLTGGFEKLDPDEAIKGLHSALMQSADMAAKEAVAKEMSSAEAGRLVDSGDARALWKQVEAAHTAFDEDSKNFDQLAEAVEAFFAYRRRGERLAVLRHPDGDLSAKKTELLEALRESRNHVLARGSVESYYASASHHRDKVRQAMTFVESCATLEEYRACLGDDSEAIEAELRAIMRTVFGDEALTSEGASRLGL